MRKIIFYLLILTFASCSQRQDNSDLFGTWKCIKEDNGMDLNEEDLIVPITRSKETTKEKKERKLIFKFNPDETIQIDDGIKPSIAEYSRKDTILIIGSRKYFIKKINTNELNIVTDDIIFATTYSFIKEDIILDSIPEYEDVVVKYENGQIETQGQYHNGNMNGKWITYYKSGKIKNISYFDDNYPVGTWKYYDENGKLTKKEKM